MWLGKIAVAFFLIATTTAQIPSLGWCPDYQAMANFNMNRFLGQWHEAERYFTVTELGSRCVTTNYEKMPDGRVWVSNEIRNAFTGVKRVLEGQLQVVGRDGEGKLSVKYTSLPVPYDTQYSILDTDYDNYAVVWSCSGIGPVHTQNAWVMTRERLAPGLILQRAYGVLDKFKISRAFFVKTNQEDCSIQPAPIEAIDPTPPSDADSQKVKSGVQGKISGIAANDEKRKEVQNEKKAVADAVIKSALSVPELIQSQAEVKKPAADHHPDHVGASRPEEEAEKKPEKEEAKPENPPRVASDEKPIESENTSEKKDDNKNEKKSEDPVAEVSKVDP